MRVTVCAKYFMRKGGAQTFLREFVRFLVARGHAVRVLALKGEPFEGVEVKVLGESPLLPGALRDYVHGRRLARELARDDCDVSFGEQKMWDCNVVRPGGGAQKEYETQYVYSHERCRLALRALRVFSLKRRLDLDAERKAYTSPALQRVIANSRMVRRDLLRHYPNLEGRISVVYNGANVERFRPESAAERRAPTLQALSLDPAAVTAVFMGHDFRRKGLAPAMEAVALARRFDPSFPLQLVVVGKGKIRRYRRVAEKLGIGGCTRFAGDSGEPEKYYASADVMIFPSFFDPCANVTLEALAAGLPVITTVTNGAHEILTHGVDGFVAADARDVAAMADFLLELRDDRRLQAMKRAAHDLALRHTLEDKLQEITAILEEIAETKRNRRPRE